MDIVSTRCKVEILGSLKAAAVVVRGPRRAAEILHSDSSPRSSDAMANQSPSLHPLILDTHAYIYTYIGRVGMYAIGVAISGTRLRAYTDYLSTYRHPPSRDA